MGEFSIAACLTLEPSPSFAGWVNRQQQAVYLLETPLNPAHVAEVLAGEQSSGTFVRVAGETDALRQRSRASVDSVEELDAAPAPSLPNAWIERQGRRGPWRRARVTVSFPVSQGTPRRQQLSAQRPALLHQPPSSLNRNRGP